MRLSTVLIFGLAMLAAPAAAASYSAAPATAAPGHIIARDISWSCSAAGCLGTSAESRPLILCKELAKRAGRLDSFGVDGRAFSAADLDKCNAAAKAHTGKALAAQ